MGREIRRVSVEFKWPINRVWKGFINPHGWSCTPCKSCKQTGYAPGAKKLYDQWYGYEYFVPSMTGSTPLTPETPEVWEFARRNVQNSPEYYGYGTEAIRKEALRLATMWNAQWHQHLDADDIAALIDGNRLWDFTRVPRTEEDKLKPRWNGWLKENNGYIPTPHEVNMAAITSPMLHDSSSAWVCVKAKAQRLGIELTCPKCGGEGSVWSDKDDKKAYENWKPTDPPKGRGWQMWETVSEGSPQTPVFRKPEELVEYLVTHNDYSRKAATNFVMGSGWVPSGMMVNGTMVSDVEIAGID